MSINFINNIQIQHTSSRKRHINPENTILIELISTLKTCTMSRTYVHHLALSTTNFHWLSFFSIYKVTSTMDVKLPPSLKKINDISNNPTLSQRRAFFVYHKKLALILTSSTCRECHLSENTHSLRTYPF